jgi:hypothetical protein
MGSLKNAKHEQVARGLAEGKTQAEAYVAAGYKSKYPERTCSDLLKKHPEIANRANEIRQDADVRAQRALNKAADMAAVSKGYVLQNLHEIVERCMQHGPVLDKNGDQVYVETAEGKIAPAWTFDAKGATRALHLIGLEFGMFAQRVKFDKSPFDDLPAPTLQDILTALKSMKQGRIIDHNPNAASLPAPRPRVDREPSA